MRGSYHLLSLSSYSNNSMFKRSALEARLCQSILRRAITMGYIQHCGGTPLSMRMLKESFKVEAERRVLCPRLGADRNKDYRTQHGTHLHTNATDVDEIKSVFVFFFLPSRDFCTYFMPSHGI